MYKPFWRWPLSILFGLLLLVESLLKAILSFLSPRPKSRYRPYRSNEYKRPTGYKWQDADGKWHVRYWVYDHPSR